MTEGLKLFFFVNFIEELKIITLLLFHDKNYSGNEAKILFYLFFCKNTEIIFQKKIKL